MSSKSFPNVTQAIWTCVQNTSEQQHQTVYTPPAPSSNGTSSTPAAGGHVDLTFDFDPAQNTVAYTITHKPFIVTDDEIWNGIQDTINGCSKQG